MAYWYIEQEPDLWGHCVLLRQHFCVLRILRVTLSNYQEFRVLLEEGPGQPCMVLAPQLGTRCLSASLGPSFRL